MDSSLLESDQPPGVFACDFRDIGGPVRFVSIEYNKGRLVRWLCEDWTDDT